MKKLKARKYKHFDMPMSEAELDAFSPSAADIVKHSFHPLLAYKRRERRIDFDQNPWLIDFKDREIRYACHRDAAIFSLCAREITPHYEDGLKSRGLAENVTAYRAGIGSNVDFALDLFNEVKSRTSCYVACFDVSKFFDNICHDQLKAQICALMGVTSLPPHLYRVFRQVTEARYVNREDVEPALGGPSGKSRLCSPSQFRSKIAPLISGAAHKGVAQGTSLSGLFANIYMIEFDAKIANAANSMGGIYRRYSDDIAIVANDYESLCRITHLINVEINRLRLTINSKKTTVSGFYSTASGLFPAFDELQYLGFTFDGHRILLRSSSLRKFYSKMRSNVRRYVRLAAKKGIPKTELHMRGLFRRFTHWGDDRNFVQYAYRAARKMASPEIKRQLRNHVPLFQNHYERCVLEYY